MTKHRHFRVYLPKIIAVVLILVIVVGVVSFIRGVIKDKPEKKQKNIQPITLLKPPPPPPPPPKQEPPPPEPEIEEKIEEPEPEPENLPDIGDEAPADNLGLDAEGAAGGDGFGLVGRKGGRGLLQGNPQAWYAGVVRSAVESCLEGNDDLRRSAYSAQIKIWFDIDGSILRHQLTRSSGNTVTDRLLNDKMDNCRSVGEAPPAGMNFVELKIKARL